MLFNFFDLYNFLRIVFEFFNFRISSIVENYKNLTCYSLGTELLEILEPSLISIFINY